jgi:putative ABC transport system permease protein
LPIVRGRAFTADEVGDRGLALAAPDGEAVGRMLLSAPAGEALPEDTLQVVGVVADAQLSALGRIDPYFVYVPGNGAALLIKSRADMSTTISGIRTVVRAVDPTLLLTVLPLESTLGWSRAISSTVTTLFGGLGVLALILASVGIYGVVAFAVTARYREIGVRLALGATARNVLTLILRQTMRPVIVGAAIGVVAASAISRILSSVLFGVSPVDPIGLGGAALLVLGVALTAGVMAARPATGADPTVTLRSE